MVSLLVCSAQAQTDDRFRPPRSKAESLKTKPLRAPTNPCTEYGPGFARVEGSQTCIKIGGGVGVGIGGGTTSR